MNEQHEPPSAGSGMPYDDVPPSYSGATQDSTSISMDRKLRLEHLSMSFADGLIHARTIWDVFLALNSGLDRAFSSLSLRERAQYLGAEILLCVIYIAIFFAFVIRHANTLNVISPALAADGSITPSVVKISILTAYSCVLIVVLIISAYASMLRKPPLQSAKDTMRLILGFITGQITMAGFLG